MKAIILLGIIGFAMAAEIRSPVGFLEKVIKDVVEDVIEFYTTGNDYIDIDAIINDDKQFQEYIDCFKGVKPCTELANSYKVIIPESIKQACRRCNPAQKHLAHKFYSALKEKKPEEYEYFRKTFDPENKYLEALEKAVADF